MRITISSLIFFLLTTVPFYLTAQQVAINTDGADPDASAVLDLVSTDKGLLVPRMSSAQRTAIANPAKGLMVFDNDTKNFWYYNGGVWTSFEAALPNKLVDGNFDTSVKVNQNGGDDIIYFSNNGVDTWQMTETALEPTNNGNSVFIGKGAGANDDHDDNRNTFIGKEAGTTTETGHDNTALGHKALFGSTTAYANVGLGAAALYNNTNRNGLVAIGDSSLFNNGQNVTLDIHATGNTGVGSKSLFGNTRGYYNTALGFKSLLTNSTGAQNTAIGNTALKLNSTGFNNTAIGFAAMPANTEGFNNTALGKTALWSNIGGDENVAVGVEALFSNETGVGNVAIGNGAGGGNIAGSDNIFIGKDAGGNETGSNKLYIDNSSTATPLIGGNFQSNEVTINGTIKITGGVPGEGKILTSNATGEAVWEKPTKTITIGAEHFHATSNRQIIGNHTWFRGETGSPYELIAPLNIPIGSTINNITIYYEDHSDNNLHFYLVKAPLTSTTVNSLTTTSILVTAENDNLVHIGTYLDPYLIENDHTYAIVVRYKNILLLPALWSTNVSISGFKITYIE